MDGRPPSCDGPVPRVHRRLWREGRFYERSLLPLLEASACMRVLLVLLASFFCLATIVCLNALRGYDQYRYRVATPFPGV